MFKNPINKIVLLSFVIFLFPKPALAVLNIIDVSPTVVSSPDDIVTITASASALSNSVQYLQIAFTRDAAPTNYLGLTKNLSDEWYFYKSSPTNSDLSTLFYKFTPVGSTWSGQIQGKFDINDDGFVGPGDYVLKLFKYISSSGSPSNNSFTITVNIASPSSQSAPAVQTPSAAEITVDMNNRYKLGEIFRVGLKLLNFDPNENYYLKFRAGTEVSLLNKGQTKNSNGLFADNESWDKFPLVKTSSSGQWEGEIFGYISEDKLPGRYKMRVRARNFAGDTLYDSLVREAEFISVVKAASIAFAPSMVARTASSSGVQKVSTDSGETLGTASAIGVNVSAPASQSITQKFTSEKQNASPKNNNLLIVAGAFSLLTAIGLALGGARIWGINFSKLHAWRSKKN